MKVLGFLCIVCISVFACAADTPSRTVIETSKPVAREDKFLGTAGYAPTEQERPFLKKINEGRALRQIKGEDIYTSRPGEKYYQAVLGKREPAAKDEAPAK